HHASQSTGFDMPLEPVVFESSFAEYTDVEDPKPASTSHGGGNGTKLNDDKKLRLASFAVEHADDYRRMSRAQFNHLLSEYCAGELNVTVKKPLDVIKLARSTLDDFETTRQMTTGAAMQATALHQVLAKWREVEDSVSEASATQAQARRGAIDEERAIANQMRADMMETPTARRRRRGDPAAADLASVIKDAVKELRAGNGICQQKRQDDQDERRAREVRHMRLADVEKSQSELKRKLDTMSEVQEWMQKKLRQQDGLLKEQTTLLLELVNGKAPAVPAVRTTTERETYRYINESPGSQWPSTAQYSQHVFQPSQPH
ncbi:hypothetical protein KEM52_002170, partial [Ascosphaera acerosa]